MLVNNQQKDDAFRDGPVNGLYLSNKCDESEVMNFLHSGQNIISKIFILYKLGF